MIAIEITLGAAIAGPFAIDKAALEAMITRVMAPPVVPPSTTVHTRRAEQEETALLTGRNHPHQHEEAEAYDEESNEVWLRRRKSCADAL